MLMLDQTKFADLDMNIPQEVQDQLETRVRNIISDFFIKCGPILDDIAMTHMEQVMRLNVEYNGAKKGISQVVDTAISVTNPINWAHGSAQNVSHVVDPNFYVLFHLTGMAIVKKGVPWNLDLDIGMSFCLDIFAVVQKNHVVRS